MTEETSTAADAPINELAKALAEFQGEMPTVPKSHTATVKSDKGSYSYTYAGLADVSEAAMPLLAKHGLSFITLPGGGVLTGMLLHSSGQSITASLPIANGTPQQVGSALTYMRRYLLGCMTGVVTDNDDDGQAASKPARKKPAGRTPEPGFDAASGRPSLPVDAPMQEGTRRHLFALFGDLGIPDEEQLPGINTIVGKQYTSRKDLTEADARMVVDRLKQKQRAKETAK